MNERRALPLAMGSRKLLIVDDSIKKLRDELDEYISGIKYMNFLKFSKEVLFTHEIQANNHIEMYKDDVETIYEVIHRKSKITDPVKKRRIMNLYRGYKYILERKDIDKDNLRDLYAILSKDLLSKDDLSNMGDYYRINPVYIFYSSNFDKQPDQGVDGSEVDKYMDILLEYANTGNEGLSKAELFLKSQIMHFYFVYIHPYYDINGRTSRTTAMWYLLKNKSYPFIIFNRAIELCKNEYYKVIRETKKYADVTFFLNYMMEHTFIELQKDYIMNMIKNNCNYDLTSVDYQSLRYILSMKSNLTYSDFVQYYNLQNEFKGYRDVFIDMLLPLLDKGIIIEGRETKKHITPTEFNHTFCLNSSMIDLNDPKIKKIEIARKIK